MNLLDAHAHYNDEKFEENRKKIIENVHNFGVNTIINAGYSLESSKKAIEIAKKYDFMYATVGVSPNDVENLDNNYLNKIEEMARNNKVVAIGEIGLDYYWNKENKNIQQDVFIKQIELANKLNLPIVIHTRDAVMDTIDILKNKASCKNKGVFHCCPLNIELIKEGLKLGFYISFAGPCTYKSTKNAEEIIRMVPLDRILIETDSPYLSPEPLRGTRNDSRNVKLIAKKIADVKQLPLEEIAKITYQNAERILRL